jgi:hypothetical protein
MIYCRLAAWLYSQRRKDMTSKQGPETFRHLLVCVTACSCHYSIHFSWHMLAGHAPRIKVPLTCVVCRAKLVSTWLITFACKRRQVLPAYTSISIVLQVASAEHFSNTLITTKQCAVSTLKFSASAPHSYLKES